VGSIPITRSRVKLGFEFKEGQVRLGLFLYNYKNIKSKFDFV
jgi:hypothetical protein